LGRTSSDEDEGNAAGRSFGRLIPHSGRPARNEPDMDAHPDGMRPRSNSPSTKRGCNRHVAVSRARPAAEILESLNLKPGGITWTAPWAAEVMPGESSTPRPPEASWSASTGTTTPLRRPGGFWNPSESASSSSRGTTPTEGDPRAARHRRPSTASCSTSACPRISSRRLKGDSASRSLRRSICGWTGTRP